MAKWICNNKECLNKWSEKEPICCPQCGSSDFIQRKSNTTGKWGKIVIFAGVLLIALIAFFMLRQCSSGDVNVNVDFEKEEGTINVDINIPVNYSEKEFKIELVRSGSVYESIDSIKSKTFTNLNHGSYYVNVKYIGNKVAPNIIIDNKGPFEIIESIQKVQINITNCFPVPDYKTKKYTVTIEISPDSLKDICEYSVDSGKTFQQNKVFILDAGTYKLMARMKSDDSNKDLYDLLLKEIINIPSQKTIQALLDKISVGDMNAYDEINALFNNAGVVKVTGAGDINTLYNLINDCNLGNQYQITNMQITDKQITIYVTKK